MRGTLSASKYGRRYPWDRWFARGRFTIMQGHDFNGRLDTMAVQVRAAALARGLRVQVIIDEADASLAVAVKQD
jgi:hypothetical protein